jgi:hypothetical protein
VVLVVIVIGVSGVCSPDDVLITSLLQAVKHDPAITKNNVNIGIILFMGFSILFLYKSEHFETYLITIYTL